MRNKVISDSKIIQLIDFGAYMIFDSASIQTMIMLFQKNKLSDNYNFDFRKLTKPKAKKEDAIALLAKNQNDAEYLTPTITRKDFLSTLLTFNNQVNEIILRKINSRVSYFTKDEVAQGIVFPQDFLNKKNQAILDDFNVGDGIFGLSDNEKNNLHLSPDELELIKPYFTTEQVKKYYTLPCNQLWLIYTDSSFKNPNSLDSFPNLKNHLDGFREVITSDNKPYGLHRAREERFFRNEKIIVQRKCAGRPSFSYSDFDTYVSATFYLIQSDRFDIKFLLGLLNSKLIEFWLKNKGKMQGDNYQLDKEPLLEIPIKNTNKSIQKSIKELVDKIIKAKEVDIDAETKLFEAKIDSLVFELYELTKEDIQFIEQNLKNEISVEQYEAVNVE
jgi:adenine-specific DNA-methyltransferase